MTETPQPAHPPGRQTPTPGPTPAAPPAMPVAPVAPDGTSPPAPADTPMAARARDVASQSIESVRRVTRENNALAAVALVVACLGIVTFVCAPIGAVLGHVARRTSRENGQAGRGMALAAVVIGWGITLVYSCGLVMTAVFLVAKGVLLLSLIG